MHMTLCFDTDDPVVERTILNKLNRKLEPWCRDNDFRFRGTTHPRVKPKRHSTFDSGDLISVSFGNVVIHFESWWESPIVEMKVFGRNQEELNHSIDLLHRILDELNISIELITKARWDEKYYNAEEVF